jgi:EAL domain-containing protein (putative c-di-GMP-specific phosphodiesterase class I)
LKDESLVAWLIHLNENAKNMLFGIEISHESLEKYFPVVAHLRQKCPYLAIIIDDMPSDCELLSRALELKIQAVKLSSDLINATSAEKSNLLALVDLCRSNNTKLIVEHIENKETLLLALSIGIEYGQGFYLSLPAASV